MTDQRLAPNARKYPELWQLYLTHNELTEMRKRHNLRLSSIEAGKSSLKGAVEHKIIELFNLDSHVAPKNKEQKDGSIFQMMVDEAVQIPIYPWLISHRGIAEKFAVKLIALIDDIEKFDTIAKLWRYAGYGLYEYWQDKDGKFVAPFDGWRWQGPKDKRHRVWTIVCPEQYQKYYTVPAGNEWVIFQNNTLEPFEKVDFIEPGERWKLVRSRDRLCKDYHSPYNGTLKSLCWLISDNFMKQRTPIYRDIYDYEKERQIARGLTKQHADLRAKRKMSKEFLKQTWINWRLMEGLPVSEEY